MRAAMQGAPEWFGWAVFLWSMPFIWIALSMSVRKASFGSCRSPTDERG